MSRKKFYLREIDLCFPVSLSNISLLPPTSASNSRMEEVSCLIEENPSKKQKPSVTSIAIIGTAGRKADEHKLTKEIWNKMIVKAEDIITKEWEFRWSEVALVSGGAAYSDHVAVVLFTKNKQETRLTLELPCAWDKTQFKDLGIFSPNLNPGGTSNFYHRKFSKKMGIDSLEDIARAIEEGADIAISKGFNDRNNKVARADRMIAFTFGDRNPQDGGTGFTWKCSKSPFKKHICLAKL